MRCVGNYPKKTAAIFNYSRSFNAKSERQMKVCQLGEHQEAPLPFVDLTITEKAPVVAFAFVFGNEPSPGAAGIEILDEDFGIEAFLLLGAERMILEFRDDFFCQQFHNNHILHCPERPDSKEEQGTANDRRQDPAGLAAS